VQITDLIREAIIAGAAEWWREFASNR